jgi:dTDP-4-amino-4,6-dideoxygalactose transaminase
MIYQKLIEFAKKSRFRKLFRRIWRVFNKSYYPFILGNEMKTIQSILNSGVWNMSSEDGFHVKLEREFASFIGVKHAILVSSGGMAIQMSLRALELKPGDEVIVQVDTCVANAFAILNAGVTPIFSDISLKTFKLDFDSVEHLITPRTKAIMPIHIWGNAENMEKVKRIAENHNLKVIEDCALSIGATFNGCKVGQFGDLGIFSFGSTKPLQAGEGGFIVTNNDSMVKILRTMRNWGDMTHEYGIRDQDILSWNGRMSEITAGLIYEQLINYNKFLECIRSNAKIIIDYVGKCPYLEIADSSAYNDSPIYTQIVLRLSKGIDKQKFMERLKEENISVWHANFEPITGLSFFKNDKWKEWILAGDLNFVDENYKNSYENSKRVYSELGIGIMRNNFTTEKGAINVTKKITKILNEFNL